MYDRPACHNPTAILLVFRFCSLGSFRQATAEVFKLIDDNGGML